MNTAQSFWDRVADGYAKRPIKDQAAYEQTLERVRSYLSGEDLVLELGCGTGTTALLLAGSVKQITATDVSPRMIEICRQKAHDQQVHNVSFEQAEAEGSVPGSGEGAYDAVFAFNLLHLLRDIPAAVGRANALLKPGGFFISKTVCLAEKKNLMRLPLFIMKTLGFAPLVNFLNIRQLDAVIAAQGFEILETGLYPPSLPSRFIVARKI